MTEKGLGNIIGARLKKKRQHEYFKTSRASILSSQIIVCSSNKVEVSLDLLKGKRV